jgi:hypothetical protein
MRASANPALKYHLTLPDVDAPERFMDWKVRRGNLVSQHIEVALVYKHMLGLDEAVAYLERASVPQEIAQRVLFTERKRPLPGTSGALAQAPYVGCRRKNRVHDAIVEAALKIEKKLGRDMALALLRDEQVPESVAARVLAQEPGQLRARRPTS